MNTNLVGLTSRPMVRHGYSVPVFALVLVLFLFHSVAAATLPSGFTETQIASGLINPTAMAFAPDGRLFVCEQAGQLRVIKNGALLAQPFVSLTVDAAGERGLLGVTFDPDFALNHFVYVYYTATTPATHNRVSRFTANGDVAVAGSEVTILDLNNLSAATNHNGGAIHFGPDGKLYVAVGENASPANAQSLNNLLGKILRINSDGSIPTDNPFFNTAAGNNRAIWALGLRNPYTFAFQPGTGRMFINDVGQSAWEEIDIGQAGANYGWPACEGLCSNPSFVDPLFAYPHSGGNTVGCAITGGAFYNPQTNNFPPSYSGTYLFADFCSGWIKRVDPLTAALTDFASGIANPVDLQVAADGSLYYLARGVSRIFRIHFNGIAPSIVTDPVSQTVNAGESVTFSVSALGDEPLSYQWQRNQSNIGGANTTSYTIMTTNPQDNGAQFRVVVTNSAGSATSNPATLTVVSGPEIEFSAAGFSASEGDRDVTVTVVRRNDSSGSASVRYANANGTATESSDYTTARGLLVFNPGETTKTIPLLLTDDAYFEGNETLSLLLSSPNGAALGSQTNAIVTITDNEFGPPTTNPADNTSVFVRQQYLDFLNREPDEGGFVYWSNEIDSCGNDLRCIHQRRINVSAAFFVEAEFQDTGFFIYRLYKAALGSRPTYIEFMEDRTRLQEGPNLTTEKQDFVGDFVIRPEFLANFPVGLGGSQFVDAILLVVRNASLLDLGNKRAELLSEYDLGANQTSSRARVLMKLIEYPEYRQAEFNAGFVLAQYFGYLRRGPDEGGYNFWLDVLNNREPNNYRAMVCAFLTSTEYQERFSSVITRANRDCGP